MSSTKRPREEAEKHYDDKRRRTETRRERNEDTLMGPLRRRNNFMKTAALHRGLETLDPNERIRVVDLACGDGADVGKYARHKNISHVTFVDVAEKCLNTCKERCKSFAKGRGVPYGSVFLKADLRMDSLDKDLDGTADVVVCHYAIHYMFGEDEHTYRFFRTVRRLLKPGGIFIFTTPVDVVEKYWPEGGNALMRVNFLADSPRKSYRFSLREAVKNVVEHVVDGRKVRREAKRQDMEVLYDAPFETAYDDHMRDRDICKIAKAMRATENMSGNLKEVFEFYGMYVLKKKCPRPSPSSL